MRKISVSASSRYDVLAERGLLDRCGELIAERVHPCKAVLVSDDTVWRLYGERARASLVKAGFSVFPFLFPHGESGKTLSTYTRLLEFLASSRLTRGEPVIALGGGVVGDLAGFAAATWLRGVPFIQIPTTFLAASDSSVGGKTALNLPEGKNLVGAFWPPVLVLCDCDCFDTLSAEQWADGFAESLKHGLIADSSFFYRLASGPAFDQIESIIARNVEIKRDFVAADEYDRGMRRLLNFGHTIGHAIEQCSDFSIPHGHGVAMGMVCVSKAAFRLGYTRCDCAAIIREALVPYDLPVRCPFGADALCRAAAGDKKRIGDRIHLICLEEIGRAKTVTIPTGELFSFISAGL